jgi:hypothetical protein
MLKMASKRWKRIRLWKSDLKGAYRQLPLNEEERSLGTMLLGDWVVTPITLGFGSRAAVFHFTQFSLLVTSLTIALTAAPTLVYIDDEFGVVPEEPVVINGEEVDMGNALFDRVRDLHAAMGVDLHPVSSPPKDDDKSVAPTRELVVLGLTVTLKGKGYLISANEEKKAKMKAELEEGIRGTLFRNRADKLAGALGFLAYGFRSRMARGYLRGIYDYHYSLVEIGKVKTNFLWWYHAIDEMYERNGIIEYDAVTGDMDFALMWADASTTNIGCVLAKGSRRGGATRVDSHFNSMPVPLRAAQLHKDNSPLREACGLLAAVLANGMWLKDREVLLLGDCRPANGTIARGYSSSPNPVNRLIATNIAIATSMVAGCTPCGLWLQYCPGAWMVGDPPSRPGTKAKWKEGATLAEGYSELGVMYQRSRREEIAISLIDELIALEEIFDPESSLARKFCDLARFGSLSLV